MEMYEFRCMTVITRIILIFPLLIFSIQEILNNPNLNNKVLNKDLQYETYFPQLFGIPIQLFLLKRVISPSIKGKYIY